MRALEVNQLTFGYGADQLFDGVSFAVEEGERVALVAPNGSGKSTLFRIIAGEIPPEKGHVAPGPNVRVAYYRQSHEVARGGTVHDAFLSGFAEVVEAERALREAEHLAASGEAQALDALSRAQDRFHLLGGDALERKVQMIASHLGFSNEALRRPVSSLSGGELGRLHLGVVLAQEAELLLLDEPTNHLDLDTIGWLEALLLARRCAILCVSHDRTFLDNVFPRTMELGSRSFRSYPKKYSDYVVEREADLEREGALVEAQQAFVAKTEDFIRKNIAGQKTKQAQSRRRMLEKMDMLEGPEDVWQKASALSFRFVPAPRSGDIVLEATGLAASRGGKQLFSKVDLLLRRGERLGIIGPNGAGKSTLLKLLLGQLGPDDQGQVKRGTNLREGYFEQHLGALKPEESAIDTIRSVRGELTVDATRAYLARFRFYGDDVFRAVRTLSGGERSRLALAKLLLEPRNLLFLDEPTNHLDIFATEILEEALANFEGTVVVVSHDRHFLDRVATRIAHVSETNVDLYAGKFKDYMEQVMLPPAPRPTLAPKAPKAAHARPEAKNTGRDKFEEDRAERKAIDKKKRRVSELEKLIAQGETALEALREDLKKDPEGDWGRLADLANKERALTKEVGEWVEEWAQLSDELSLDGHT